MKYHFRVGRGKNIIISGNETFEELGFMILNEYNMTPDHLFMFEFANGDATDAVCPFGPMHEGLGNVPAEMKIEDRKMEAGEVMTFVYDFASEWTRKVKLMKILL